MKKVIPLVALLGALSLAACTDEGETVVVQPPPQQGSTVVVPERDDGADRVIIPPRNEPTVIVPTD